MIFIQFVAHLHQTTATPHPTCSHVNHWILAVHRAGISKTKCVFAQHGYSLQLETLLHTIYMLYFAVYAYNLYST